MLPLEIDKACHEFGSHVFPTWITGRFHPSQRPDGAVVQPSEVGSCNAGKPCLGSVFEGVREQFIEIGVPGFLPGCQEVQDPIICLIGQ